MILRRTALKLSTIILLVSLLLVVAGLFASNLAFRQEYAKLDLTDKYWAYNKVLQQPFSHIKIDGSSITKVVFEQGQTASVRVKKYLTDNKHDVKITETVKNDTLYIKFDYHGKKADIAWMKDDDMVLVFAPLLLSVDAKNTDLELHQFKQNSLNINLKGSSALGVETAQNNFDTFNITQSDSSKVRFTTSPNFKGAPNINFARINANLTGASQLDLGNGRANYFKLNMADNCVIVLSGQSIGKLK